MVVGGDVARSTTAAAGETAGDADSGIRVATGPSPGGLTGIGTRISQLRSEWADDGDRLAVWVTGSPPDRGDCPSRWEPTFEGPVIRR